MKNCLDEGMMQTYLDGELSPDAERAATAHIAGCRRCVEMMSAARNESGFFAQAFALADEIEAPTERLRARVNAAIAQLESAGAAPSRREPRSNVNSLLASLTGIFTRTPRRAVVAFASVALVACVAIFALINRSPSHPNEVAVNENQPAAVNVQPTAVLVEKGQPTVPPVSKGNERQDVFVNVGENKPARVRIENASYNASRNAGTEKLLANERQYRESIASLNKTITAGGDALLRPSVRADYERNVALLDNAIAETRNVALRNPNDRDAVNFLLSAYQSKVELMTTIANQAQVATLGR